MKASMKQIRPSNWKEHSLSSKWMIIDWDGDYFKKHTGLKPNKAGGCCVYTLENQPEGIDVSLYSVSIHSDAPMKITSLGLRKHAWRPEQNIGQCDALLFPTSDNNGDAFLLVETKYSENASAWQIYKDSALKQITDTIFQLSQKGCPIRERNLFGLVSCPLLNPMGATAFSLEELTIIFAQHGVTIGMGNSATFQDSQTISF